MFFLKKYISVLLFFLIKILINLKLNFLASFLILNIFNHLIFNIKFFSVHKSSQLSY